MSAIHAALLSLADPVVHDLLLEEISTHRIGRDVERHDFRSEALGGNLRLQLELEVAVAPAPCEQVEHHERWASKGQGISVRVEETDLLLGRRGFR